MLWANVLKFLMRPKPQKAEYSRAEQHKAVQEIAAAGDGLLKTKIRHFRLLKINTNPSP